MARALNAKQQAFVAAYVETGNATEAVRRAGYATRNPDKRGSEILGTPVVAAAVASLRAKVENRVAIDKGEILGIVASIARADGTGDRTMAEDRDRLTACRDLAKMLGYNEPERHEVTVVDYKSRLEAMLGPGDDGDLSGDAAGPDA